MKGTVWLGLIALSILVALACQLPGTTPPEGVQTAIANLGDGVEEELLDEFIILTPRAVTSPALFFSSERYFVNEADRLVTITVLLDPPATQPVTVNYATSNGTAIAPLDYTATSGTLQFSPGQGSNAFTIPIILDSLAEITETVTLTLSDPVNVVLGQPNPAVLFILDQGAGGTGGPIPVVVLPGDLTPTPSGTPNTPLPPTRPRPTQPPDNPNPTTAPPTLPPATVPPTAPLPTNPPPTQPPVATPTPTADNGSSDSTSTPTPTPTIPPVLVVNTADDNNDGTCTTIHCSLREAINDSNIVAGLYPVTIQFAIPGGGPHTIRPNPSLPLVTSPVVIDATTQPGASCASWPPTLLVELDGSNAGSGGNGLHLVSGNATVTGFVINRFGGNGVVLDTNNANRVVCNLIGTDISGTSALGNSFGIFGFNGSSNNVIGGSTASERNLISGNIFQGVRITDVSTTGNVVQGNYIGTNVNGTADLGNGESTISQGVFLINATGNIIGGGAAGAGNLISGNGGAGIRIFGSSATGNVVYGNRIGTDASGTVQLENSTQGVLIDNGAAGNFIGGTNIGERNLISGNGLQGINISGSGTTGNVVQGNYIGTDLSGTADLGNGDATGSAGVLLQDAANNIIGGAVAGAGNLISGNGSAGVRITGLGTNNNMIQGNFIGTNAAGTATIGNTTNGIQIDGTTSGTIVGGNVAAARNIISGNGIDGVRISGAGTTGNVVQGNYIGTGINGLVDLGNAAQGLTIDGSAGNNIGGTTVAVRNLISGNNQNGIYLLNVGATNNQIQGNYVGTDVSGILNLRNSLRGILLGVGTTGNSIGGTTAGAGNRIAFNGGGIRNDGDRLSLAFNTVISNTAANGGGIYNVGRLTVVTATIRANTVSNAGGGIWNSGAITLTNSNLVNNAALGGLEANDGGGLYNHTNAVASLTTVTLQGNSATDGAGIFNTLGSTLSLNNSRIVANVAAKNGGGLENDSNSLATVIGSSVTNNTTTQSGGGIYNLNGTMVISNSAISRNGTVTNEGGGLWNSEDTGAATMTITNTTISNNAAATFGGGLFNQSAGGGAIVNLAHSTISSNTVAVATNGGGIRAENGTINLSHTIVANSGAGDDCSLGTGNINSIGYNLSSDATCPFVGVGDIVNTNPLLGLLQNNGGSTETHALQVGSPAINVGNPAFIPPPTFDQRGPGFPRIQNGLIDIGAFESPF